MHVSEIMYDQEIVLFLLATGFVTLFHIYIVSLALWWTWKHNPLKKHKKKWVEQSLIMTTATLFKAAESKSQYILDVTEQW